MMSRRNDWFRHGDLWEFFDRLQDEGFFACFDEVCFYGSSMGGYGALTYARAAPGCRVVALMPQTHLDQDIVPFETRYRTAYGSGDWRGAYLDGAEGARTASQVCVLYDPYHALDAAHVARLDHANFTALQMPWSGHQAARVLHKMGLLQSVVTQGFAGTLTASGFRKQVRQAECHVLGVRVLLNAALERGHKELVRGALDGLDKRGEDWSFPKIRRALAD